MYSRHIRTLKSGITLAPRAAIGGSVVGEGRLTTRLRVSIGRGVMGIKTKYDKKLDVFAKELRKKIYRCRNKIRVEIASTKFQGVAILE